MLRTCEKCGRSIVADRLFLHQRTYQCQTFGQYKPNKPTLKEWLLKQNRHFLPYRQQLMYDSALKEKEISTLLYDQYSILSLAN